MFTGEERKWVGERLLGLYFRQVLSDAPIFFDLRPSRLSWNGRRITWEASNAFYAVAPSFRRSLRDLYRSYYEDDLPLLRRSLRELSLVAEGADADVENRLAELLLRHFTGGREGTVRFSMAAFKESFDSLFSLVLDSGNRLSPDFAFVGLLLASLYLSLQTLDVDLEVAAQYHGGHVSGLVEIEG